MTLKKILGAGALLAALTFSSCGDNPEYHYDGILDGKKVRFYETDINGQNHLEVTAPDGTKITYNDRDNDGKLDDVLIDDGYHITTYRSSGVIGMSVLSAAQKNYYSYLKQIVNTKRNIALNNFK